MGPIQTVNQFTRTAKTHKRPMKPTPPRRANPPGYRRQVPYIPDISGILGVIPPSYDDVSVHYNYPNKRNRRSSEGWEGNTYLEAAEGFPVEWQGHSEADVEDVVFCVVLEYDDWYNDVHMLSEDDDNQYYRAVSLMMQMEEYQSLKMQKQNYNEALLQMENYELVLQQLMETMLQRQNYNEELLQMEDYKLVFQQLIEAIQPTN